MYLFILESIGMSELILIGIVALIIFGPRKLPGIAKTVGKTIADLKRTTNEFKETWEKESSMAEIQNEMQDFSIELSKIKKISTEQAIEKNVIEVSPKTKEEIIVSEETKIENPSVQAQESQKISGITGNLPSEKQSWL